MNATEFIKLHQTTSPAEVALLLSKKPELNKEFIINQINGLQKAKNKLPEFYQNVNVIYPSPLSMEQCSSEKTALYKSKLIEGNSLVDLTGGLGIDSYYFAKQFEEVTYIEKDKILFDVALHNFKILNSNNIKAINTTTEDFLKLTTKKFDIAYIDPSRRNENKRVFLLNDCSPNIIDLSDAIFKIADRIMIKTAPLLDIKQSVKELKTVTTIFVVAVNNDCKEVIYLLEKNKPHNDPQIHTINFAKEIQEYSFNFTQETNSNSNLSSPQNYLYEPNSAILKAGAFNSLCHKYNINKLASNSHLYTSLDLVEKFPGRTFKIENTISYNLKEFKKLDIKQANITCRNFKDRPEEVKKKLKLKDGEKHYLFATTDKDNKPILVCCVK